MTSLAQAARSVSESMKPTRLAIVSAVAVAAAAVAGCSSPNAANIQLRKENQDLREKVAGLERQHAADVAQMRAMERSATTVPVLPQQRVQALFTTHGLQFGRLTGGADLDRDKPGDEGLKVYVVPIDGQGQPLKAAGSFVVEAFDLADAQHPRVGHWEFPLDQAEKNWFGQAMLYTYVLTCPWQHGPPRHRDLTLRVTFTDALTQRQFTEQKQVKVTPPPTAPATTRRTAGR
jgi:outer membrane murein-binding lipoprotein Lpp